VYLTLNNFLQIFLPNSTHFIFPSRSITNIKVLPVTSVHFPYTFPHLENHFTSKPILSATVPVANFTQNAGQRNSHYLFTEAPRRKNKQVYKINIIDLSEDAVYIMVLINDEATMSVLSLRPWCSRSLHLLSIRRRVML
jgi:hypothetical protein